MNEPCIHILISGYPAAVHNTRHVGNCIAQLILRLRDTGNHDIHLIGFSLYEWSVKLLPIDETLKFRVYVYFQWRSNLQLRVNDPQEWVSITQNHRLRWEEAEDDFCLISFSSELFLLSQDPAMPLFVTADIDNKLDESDAEFVDVFHTNALVQGKVEQCGHVDFYFNGGVTQPGCPQSAIFQCSQWVDNTRTMT